MPRNTLFTYVRSSDGRTVRAVANTASGFFAEWSDDSIKTRDVQAAFDCPEPVAITEGWRGTLVASLNDVQHLDVKPIPSTSSSSHALEVPAWTGAGAIIVIAIVELVRLVLTVAGVIPAG